MLEAILEFKPAKNSDLAKWTKLISVVPKRLGWATIATIAVAVSANSADGQQAHFASYLRATKCEPERTAVSQLGQVAEAGCSVLRATFPDHLPRRPYCTNSLRDRIFAKDKFEAIRHRYISLNGPTSLAWMPFDVDHAGAYFADDDANLPPANVVMVNPMNGRAHLAYLLAKPVHKYDAARRDPINYYAAVERGFTRRLGADPFYVGLIQKNPVHADWAVEWRRDEPYTLDQLDDWLFERDKRFDPTAREQFGVGRNCTTFDELRAFAYREVLEFKSEGASLADFQKRLEAVALGINRQFQVPLPFSEIRATAKSVSKWTWGRFSPERFSKIQSHRGKIGMAKRWAGHVAESTTNPWEALGISRRTYYRKKAKKGSFI